MVKYIKLNEICVIHAASNELHLFQLSLSVDKKTKINILSTKRGFRSKYKQVRSNYKPTCSILIVHSFGTGWYDLPIRLSSRQFASDGTDDRSSTKTSFTFRFT